MAGPRIKMVWLNGRRIRELRLALHLTQEALARHVQCSKGYISLIEQQKRLISSELAERIADFFKIPVSELADPAGKPAPKRMAASSTGSDAVEQLPSLLRLLMDQKKLSITITIGVTLDDA